MDLLSLSIERHDSVRLPTLRVLTVVARLPCRGLEGATISGTQLPQEPPHQVQHVLEAKPAGSDHTESDHHAGQIYPRADQDDHPC